MSDEIHQQADPFAEGSVVGVGKGQGQQARGSMLLFTLAFAFLLAAGGSLLFSVRGFLDSLTPLWISVTCSVISAALAVAALVVPRRR